MKCVICLFSVAWISYGATADAQLEIVEPASNAVVSLLTPAQELFLRLPPSARRTLIADRKQGRPYLNRVKWWPEPVHVKWTDAGTGPYSLKILREEEEVFATNGLEQCHFDVWNLEVAREYRIRVSGGATAVESTFRTFDHAPRLLRIDSIPNVRDLGGRIGLDGRRVRQGLIYRSAGLNENANDYCTGPETYELWKTGRLADSEEGREYLVWINEHKTLRPEDFKEMKKTMVVKNWRPGFDRLTSVDRDYMARKLGIRTDIDLRSKRECYGMKGSPLGESVRWIHAPYSAYGGITNEMGRTAFAKAFSALLDERNYPVDFHCIAGADRTGSLAYLLNALLGVREDELTKDWEVTVWWSPTMHGHAVCLDQLSAALSSFPGETVCERAENYAIQAGFSRADIEKFRKIMLEDVRLAAVPESGGRVDLSGVPFKMPAIELPHFPAREFSIVDFGARSNGEKCTDAIARAIGACADAGGGRVIVPNGVFHTGAIRLKSNVELCLSSGAVLDFSDDPEDYMPAVASSFEGIECMNRSSLVYAYGCTNVAITGSGLLRPRIGFWLRWSGSRSANSLSRKASDQLTLWGDLGTPVSERNFVGLTESRARPQTLLFNRCRNVRLKDFRIRGTPFWTVHLYRCENVVAKGLDDCCHGVCLRGYESVVAYESVGLVHDDHHATYGSSRDECAEELPDLLITRRDTRIVTDLEVGMVMTGKVTRILEFGAFVEILPGKEGLLHVSEIAWEKTEKVEDVLKVGDEVDVKLLEIDAKTGKMRLSMRALTPKPEGYVEPERKPRNNDRGPRRDSDKRDGERRGGNEHRPERRGSDRGNLRHSFTPKQENEAPSFEEPKEELF